MKKFVFICTALPGVYAANAMACSAQVNQRPAQRVFEHSQEVKIGDIFL